jgi:hypothetical protein
MMQHNMVFACRCFLSSERRPACVLIHYSKRALVYRKQLVMTELSDIDRVVVSASFTHLPALSCRFKRTGG